MLNENRVRDRVLLWALAALTVNLTACGDETSYPQEEQAPTTLTQGARGPEVRAAYQYLQNFGYFPNAEFERNSPQFRPMAPAPADPDVLDENLAAGLRKFQKNVGISVTGDLDTATQALIGQPRCGVLDLDPDVERDSKWAFFSTSNRWNTVQTEITFSISTAGCGADCLPASSLSTAHALSNIRSAFQSWGTYIYPQFTEVTTGGDIVISFISNFPFPQAMAAGLPPGPSVLPPFAGPSVLVNKDFAFSSSQQFKDTMIHEVGHVMGLLHTPEKAGPIAARMYPFIGDLHMFLPGDAMGANVALGAFDNYEGFDDAMDLDANRASNFYTLWALASDGTPMQYSGGSWIARPGITGMSIAVCADDTAWVVKTGGGISSWNASNSTWTGRALPPGGGTARAIGCSQGDVVDPMVTYLAMSTGNIFSRIGGGAWSNLGAPGGDVNDVDADQNGVVYALKSNRQLWQYKAGAWSRHSTKLFIDIAVGGDDYRPTLWGIDTNQMAWAWAEQGVVPNGEPAVTRWEPINEPGPIKRIAASQDHAFAIWADWAHDGMLMRRTWN